MVSNAREPRTPQRNNGLVSAWSRNQQQRLVPSPSEPPPRRVVLPASAPPDTPKTTNRIRRLTFDPTPSPSQRPPINPSLPPNVPTEPAAMRRAQQKQATQDLPTPRRRVVPNILAEDESEPLSLYQTKPEYTNYIQPYQPCMPFTPTANDIKAAQRVDNGCCSSGRYNDTNYYGYTSQNVPKVPQTGFVTSQVTPTKTRDDLPSFRDTRMRQSPGFLARVNTSSATRNDLVTSCDARAAPGDVHPSKIFPDSILSTLVPLTSATSPAKDLPNTTLFESQIGRNIAGTNLVNYTAAQQSADYRRDLMAGSEPEETWESRRKAPMVPNAQTWLESDLFATQWYNAIILSYRQDAENGERLGGTVQEKEKEMQAKQAGHLTGVNVDLEIARHRFEADLLRRARDMILRDNGVMPRGAIGEPAVDGQPQAWSDGMNGMRR